MSFVPEKSISFSPTLAATIGLQEAILLQLLQECVSHNDTYLEDGLRWVKIKEEKLLELAPFWQLQDLVRWTDSLKAKGVLLLRRESNAQQKFYDFAFNEHNQNTEISKLDSPENHEQRVIYSLASSQQSAKTMKNDWRPGTDCLRQLYQLGVSQEFALQQIPQFIAYWRDRNVAKHSWESKYIKDVWREWQKMQSTNEQRRKEISLTEDWKPSSDAIEILVRNGEISGNFVEDAIPEFILYWRDRGDVSSTWDSKFVQHVRRQWNFYSGMTNEETMPQPISESWQPRESVYDVLKMANIDRQFAEQLLPQFVIYWCENGASQSSWSTKFLQFVKSEWARGRQTQITESSHGKQLERNPKGRIRDRNIIEALSDRSWAS
ncbi:MAG: hypothetical protein CBD08_005385 [Cellvibrionales bacterium TMED148]|nr:hypothetical protein [Porticoccaceae bacterium]RPG89972.1 MAG: hypothetical protein CBD08_005385 [Cellvibrionales bacterium TMED148]